MKFYKSEPTAAERRWPFACVDDTDGKTAEPSLTFSAGELQISKNGAAYANVAGTVTELTDGTYYYEATAAELDTNGFLLFKIEKTGVRLTIMHVGQVVSYDSYDQTALGLTSMPSNVTVWNGSAVATPTVAGVPEVDVTHWIGTAAATPTTAGVPEVDITHWKGTVVPAPNTAGYPLIDVIKWTGVDVDAPVVAGHIPVDVGYISGGNERSLQDWFGAGQGGGGSAAALTAQAGGSSTSIKLNAGESAVNDHLKDWTIRLVGGTGVQDVRIITAYDGTTKIATVDRAFSATPDGTTTYITWYPRGGSASSVNAAAIADAVWDEALSGHVTAGTSGKKLTDLSTTAPLDAAATAAAVWNAAIASYNSAGTFGEFVQDLATQARDVLLAYSHDTGLTVKGFFRRMDALAAGRATGLRGALASYFMRDGTTPAIAANQDVETGSRSPGDVSGSEA